LADNFSLAELSGVIRQSHEREVKVYVALNSLIKETELPQAYETLMALAELNPDAFIIQDLGLASLARRYCPQIPLHASTLTAVYSRAGLVALQKLGFQRVVLPRELSLREIDNLLRAEILPLEVFIHGSMCFSFSGLCLFSSFLGGRSALRGGCAQPCRRSYSNGPKKGTFFSAADLMAAEALPIFKSSSLAALKIEGRMKGPDYVSRVVKAYRLLLDAPPEDFEETLREAKALLSQVAGRPASLGFLTGPSAALVPQGVAGLKIGFFEPLSPDSGQIKLDRSLALKDRLRLVPAAGQEGLAFKLKKMVLAGEEIQEAEAGSLVTIFVGLSPSDKALGALPKGVIYLTTSGQEEKAYLATDLVKKARHLASSYNFQRLSLPKEFKAKENGRENFPFARHLWLWLDQLDNWPEILKSGPERLVLVLTPANARSFGRWKKNARTGPQVVWSLPALLFTKGWEKARQDIARLIDQGAREFMVANLGQAEFLASLGANLKIWGDHRLGPLNHLAEAALANLGLKGLTLSPEMDLTTYQSLVKKPRTEAILLYIFGRPALFTSRFQVLGLKRGPIVSPRGEKYLAATEGDAFILQAETRVFLSGYLKTPAPQRLAGLLVDLRLEPRPGEMARLVKKAVAEGRGSLGSSFNWKRGLR
jgi:putative protease